MRPLDGAVRLGPEAGDLDRGGGVEERSGEQVGAGAPPPVGDAGPRLCVLAVTSLLTVTIEEAADGTGPELHVHPGGQGLWVARMARSLGAEVVVCGPFGGETGRVVEHLVRLEGGTLRATRYAGANAAYVHDRRDGERDEVVRTAPAVLDRHAQDDLFGTVLVEALDADVVVLTGAEPAGTVEADFFGRLAADLRATGRRVVADLSGDAAREAVRGGLDVLKISHEEMVEGGFAQSDDLDDLVAAARSLLADGVGAVVVSRAAEPTLVVTGSAGDAAGRGGRGRVSLLTTPPVTIVDHRGAGDSMTAGIAVALARGEDVVAAVRLGAAAGALNVTRHGLGSGSREQIERMVREVEVEDLDDGQEEGR
jgi:1-phosphofructokinase